jgi:hypothetical protein
MLTRAFFILHELFNNKNINLFMESKKISVLLDKGILEFLDFTVECKYIFTSLILKETKHELNI